MPPIHIVTGADDAYIPHTAAMLHSLLTSNPGESFAIHFLHRVGVSADLLARLANLCKSLGARFRNIKVARSRLDGLPIQGHYTEEAWYRVVLADLLGDIDRVLWLDSDTIVLAPIRELWGTPLDDLPLAACPNALLQRHAEGVTRMGIKDRRQYFNTGVLLLNLAALRADCSEEKLREAAARVKPWIKMADQDVLNAVYHQRWKRLPLVWNVLAHSHINVPETIRVHGRAEYDEAMRAPRIIHFTGQGPMKPWSYKCAHPQRERYLRHRALAGWSPPAFKDKNARGFIVRHIPLRPYAILRALRARNFTELMSYLREW